MTASEDSEGPALVEYILQLSLEHAQLSGRLVTSCEPDFLKAFSLSSQAPCSSHSLVHDVDIECQVRSVAEKISRMRQIEETLEAKLKCDPHLAATVHTRLDSRLRAVGISEAEIISLGNYIGDKITRLLVIHEAKCSLPGARTKPNNEEMTLDVYVITGIHLNGSPSQTRKITVGASTRWPEFESVLSEITATWQAAERGFPRGYSLEHGIWLFQTLQSSNCNFDAFEELSNAEQYELFRQRVLGSPGFKAVVCHELVRQHSRDSVNEYRELRDRRSKWPNQEPVDEQGNPYFEPFFEFESVTVSDLERAGIPLRPAPAKDV